MEVADSRLLNHVLNGIRRESNVSLELQNLSSNEDNSPCCRICRASGNSEETGELIESPCNCRGTLGFLHKLCIEKWLNRRDDETCELCGFKFATKRKLMPLQKWNVREIFDSLSTDEKGFLFLGVINLLLVFMEIPFLYFVIKMNWEHFSGLEYDTNDSKELESRIYPALLIVLLFVTLLLVAASLIFLVYGFKVLQKIISYNRAVFLVLPVESLQSSSNSEQII